MKRNLIILGVFLLFGVIVNVLVAWGCAIFMTPVISPNNAVSNHSKGVLSGKNFVIWSVIHHRVSGAIVIESRWNDPAQFTLSGSFPDDPPYPHIPYWASFLIPPQPTTTYQMHIRVLDARGWPCISMYSVHQFDGPLVTNPKKLSVTGGVSLADFTPAWKFYFSNLDRVLPLKVVWTGFAINTILYGSILWFLLRGPFVVRNWRRLKRGLCVKCAYDLRLVEHERCPECGMLVCAK